MSETTPKNYAESDNYLTVAAVVTSLCNPSEELCRRMWSAWAAGDYNTWEDSARQEALNQAVYKKMCGFSNYIPGKEPSLEALRSNSYEDIRACYGLSSVSELMAIDSDIPLETLLAQDFHVAAMRQQANEAP